MGVGNIYWQLIYYNRNYNLNMSIQKLLSSHCTILSCNIEPPIIMRKMHITHKI